MCSHLLVYKFILDCKFLINNNPLTIHNKCNILCYDMIPFHQKWLNMFWYLYVLYTIDYIFLTSESWISNLPGFPGAVVDDIGGKKSSTSIRCISLHKRNVSISISS